MKFTIIFLFIALAASISYTKNAIFLHHSTGGGVWSEGAVVNEFQALNIANGTYSEITERSYPNTPYPWSNYAYDYWHLWVDKNCDSQKPGIECLNTLCKNYDVIIWKHCYPGASVVADDNNPDITSKKQTLANYKLQYEALKNEMLKYPYTKFIIWTLAPLHRLSTNKNDAARANEFVKWVKDDWLKGIDNCNIYIFDFYGLTAETSQNPENGEPNCLKYDYEKDHNSGDSHPNTKANKAVGPIFAQFIYDVINLPSAIDEDKNDLIYPNPANNTITIPKHNDLKNYKIEIFSFDGQKIEEFENYNTINISKLPNGCYTYILSSNNFSHHGRFIKK